MITEAEWDRFFTKLAERGNITEACLASGISRSQVYEYKDGKVAEGVDAKVWKQRFDDAREQAADRLEAEAFRRAHDGVPEPQFTRDGDVIYMPVPEGSPEGTKPQQFVKLNYSDTLLTLLLKANRPDKFKDKVSQEVSGPGGKPIQTETKVIALPAIDETSQE